jgi:hypothetical protein
MDRHQTPMEIFGIDLRLHARPIAHAALLVAAGLLLNAFLERHSFSKVGETAMQYPFGGRGDLLLPILAFMVTASGLAYLLVVLFRHRAEKQSFLANLLWALPISVLLTVVYGAYFLTVQFFATGSDHYGACAGIEEAASESNDLPQSLSMPGRAALYCGSEKYGMFLWPFNVVGVYGVIDPAAQDRVLRNIRKHQRETNGFPIRIMFYESEHWTAWRNRKTGAVAGGERGPEKLIRVVTLH